MSVAKPNTTLCSLTVVAPSPGRCPVLTRRAAGAGRAHTRRESTTDESSVSKTEFDLRFRYYAALGSLPRSAYIVLNGLTLEINSVANVQLNNREIQMICEERS